MLGGLFMVQYGIENGLLSPKLRVLATLALGAALVAGGEALRRRHGDEGGDDARDEGASEGRDARDTKRVPQATTAGLPSTLSGAGLVIAFIGILSAHALYGLIGPMTALAGLALISCAGLVMGLLYGAALSGIGIIGASIAPFLLGGDSTRVGPLYPYFALIALSALSVDSFKRRAWISALGIGAPSLAIAIIWYAAPHPQGLAFAALAVAIGAATIPMRSLRPAPHGVSLCEQALRHGTAYFPTRIAGAGMALASLAGAVLAVQAPTTAQMWLGLGMLVVLAAFAGLWLATARALMDLAVPPVVGFLSALALIPLQGHLDLGAATGVAIGEMVVALSVLGALLSAIAFWRMRRAEGRVASHVANHVESQVGAEARSGGVMHVRLFAFEAALVLPAALLVLAFLWSDRFIPIYAGAETPPPTAFWGFPWAVIVLLGAGMMVAMCERSLRAHPRDAGALAARPDAMGAGYFAASAATLITLALFTLLTQAALTLAICVLVVAAVVLYARLPMAPVAWVFQLGAALIGYRLLIDPGVIWAIAEASALDAALTYIAPVLAFGAIVVMVQSPDRQGRDRQGRDTLGAKWPLMRATAESALITTAAVGVMIGLARLLSDELASHWGFGLIAAIWALSTASHLYRARQTTGKTRVLRLIFAGVSGLTAAVSALFMVAMVVFLLEPSGFFGGDWVLGPPLFDSLALALLPLALVLGATSRVLYAGRDGRLARGIERGLMGACVALVMLWGWLEIRRLWRGPALHVAPVGDGELYTYTVALFAASLGVLGVAVWRRSILLRKLAMLGVALTIAKVFLLDMSGLSGLTRVVSFVGLGLALTALAWGNRKITAIWDREAPSS